jgi:DNA-binding IclR family transcriptional regulator
MPKPRPGKETHGGVQSVEIATRLLRVLAHSSRPLPLTKLAAEAGMTPSKAHRYLSSLMRSELVRRDPVNNYYDLGALSLRLGLTALERIDEIALASAILPGLSEEIGETIVLSVWGEHGPTIIRIQESSRAVSMNARVGSVLPPTTTATGLAFSAFLPEATVRAAAARTKDWSMSEGPPPGSQRRTRSSLEEVRERRMARDVGVFLSGVSALAVPIFNHESRVVAALTALGRESSFNVDWNGAAALVLRRTADMISRQLGYVDHGQALGSAPAHQGPPRRARGAAG